MIKKILFVLFCILSSAYAEKIKICLPTSSVSTLVFIAEDQGYFKNEGLDLELESVIHSKVCQDQLLAKQVQLSVTLHGVFAYIAAKNPPFKIIASIHENTELAIIANKKSGITKAKDLENKKVGYLPGTRSALFIKAYIDKNKLNKDSIKLVTLQPPAMPSALANGIVDAVVIWQPWAYQASQGLNKEVVRLDDPELSLTEVILLAHEDFLKADPKSASKILRALIAAEDYVKNNTDAAQNFLAKKISYNQELITSTWQIYKNHVQIDKKILPLFSRDYKLVQNDVKELANIPSPDFGKFIDPSFLRQIDSKLVNYN